MLRLTWMSVLLCGALAGCAGHRNAALLEDELRSQEDRIYAMEQELVAARRDLVIAQNEAVALRKQLADRGESGLLPEQAQSLYSAVGLKFNSFLTGGANRDSAPGDEMLSVSFYPHDADGSLVKLPGRVEIEVLDPSAPAERRVAGRYVFDLPDTQRHWHSGLLASGFLFELPWQEPPEHSQLTLHVKLTAPDGREFDSIQQLKITPPERVPNLIPTSGVVPFPQDLPPEGEELPEFDDAAPVEPDEVEPSESETDAASRIRPAGLQTPSDKPPIVTSDRLRSFDPPRYR